MATTDKEPHQVDAVGGSSPPPTATDSLLPTKGEPEKSPAPFANTLTTCRADAMQKVLKKASSLTRKQNPNDACPMNRQRGSILQAKQYIKIYDPRMI